MGIIVDFDKGGLEIASVYQFGAMSSKMLQEARGDALGSRLKFLGMK